MSRPLILLAAFAALTVTVILVWPYLVGAAVLAVAWRVVRRGQPRRRRPRSSWAKLIEAGSLAAVAWNTRGIVGGRTKVTPGFTLGLGRRLKRNEQAPW